MGKKNQEQWRTRNKVEDFREVKGIDPKSIDKTKGKTAYSYHFKT